VVGYTHREDVSPYDGQSLWTAIWRLIDEDYQEHYRRQFYLEEYCEEPATNRVQGGTVEREQKYWQYDGHEGSGLRLRGFLYWFLPDNAMYMVYNRISGIGQPHQEL
jgi:hypothetical protein